MRKYLVMVRVYVNDTDPKDDSEELCIRLNVHETLKLAFGRCDVVKIEEET